MGSDPTLATPVREEGDGGGAWSGDLVEQAGAHRLDGFERAAVAEGVGDHRWAIIGAETPGQRPGFRAIGALVTPHGGGAIGLPEDARQRLGVELGQKVWLSYG